MKVTWEAKDIQGGRIIQKHDCGLSGTWMMVWSPDDDRWGLVSLADGMVSWRGNKETLASNITEAGFYLPAEMMHNRFTVELPKQARGREGL